MTAERQYPPDLFEISSDDSDVIPTSSHDQWLDLTPSTARDPLNLSDREFFNRLEQDPVFWQLRNEQTHQPEVRSVSRNGNCRSTGKESTRRWNDGIILSECSVSSGGATYGLNHSHFDGGKQRSMEEYQYVNPAKEVSEGSASGHDLKLLRTELDKKTEDGKRIRSELDKKTEECKATKEELSRVSDELQRARDGAATFEAKERRLDDMRQEEGRRNDLALAKVEVLETELRSAFERSREQLQEREEELRQAQSKIEELQDEVEWARKEGDLLRSKSETGERAGEQILALTTEAQQLRTQLALSDARLEGERNKMILEHVQEKTKLKRDLQRELDSKCAKIRTRYHDKLLRLSGSRPERPKTPLIPEPRGTQSPDLDSMGEVEAPDMQNEAPPIEPAKPTWPLTLGGFIPFNGEGMGLPSGFYQLPPGYMLVDGKLVPHKGPTNGNNK